MSVNYLQRTITLNSRRRGCHLITTELLKSGLSADLNKFTIGTAHFFIQHTSASITINENADSDVRLDMETVLNRLIPDSTSLYKHTDEGPDDLPAHIKASLLGNSITIPITAGKLNLGTWQGIWLCEHRNNGGNRTIVVTMQGLTAKSTNSNSTATSNNTDSD